MFAGRTFALDARCAQQRVLYAEIRRSRWVWNRAVALARRLRRIAVAAKAAGRPVPAVCRTSYPALCRRLTVWRRRRPWLAAGSVVPQQQTLKTYIQAEANARAGRARWPVFKKRRDPLGLRYPLPHTTLSDTTLTLAKVPGGIRLRRSSPDLGALRHVTVAHDGVRWTVSVCYAAAPVPMPEHPRMAALARGDDSAAVGLDFGVVSTWTRTVGAEDQAVVQIARRSPAQHRRTARLGRQRSRRRKGSRGWRRSVRAEQRLQRRVAAQRREQVRQFAHELVRDHAVVAFEDLRLRDMTARPRDRSGARNGRAAKAARNRRILEGAFRATVEATRWAARKTGAVVATTPAPYTSQTCAACGHTASENRESQAGFRCQRCGHTAHADGNAAHVVRQRVLVALGLRAAVGNEAEEPSPPDGRRRKPPGEPGAAKALAGNLEPAERPAAFARAG